MKRIFELVILIILMLLLSACTRVNLVTDSILGSGPMLTRDFDVSSYNSISVSGSKVIVWRESSDVSVTIAAQENILENFDVTVRNGVLHVDSHRPYSVTGNNTPRIYINTPYMTGKSVSGSATATDWDTVNVQKT